MKLKLGIEQVGDFFYTRLIEDLANYASCTVVRDGTDVVVETEGDVVACSCVVAICEKYRFSRDIKVPEIGDENHGKKS